MSATTIAHLLLSLPDALAVQDHLVCSAICHVANLATCLGILSAATSKRPGSPSAGVVTKHAKAPSLENQSQIAILSADGDCSKGRVCTVQRTSRLEAPINRPEHRRVLDGPWCVALVHVHAEHELRAAHGLAKAPITDLQWSLCSPTLYTVSTDASLTATDVRMGQYVHCVRAAHCGVINALDCTMGGGSSAGSGKQPIAEWDVGCPVTAVCWSKDGVYNLCSSAALHTLGRHTDTPTSLALLPMWSRMVAHWHGTCGAHSHCRRPHGGPSTDRGPAAPTPRGVAPCIALDTHARRLPPRPPPMGTPLPVHASDQTISTAVTYVPIGRIECNCVDHAIGTCTSPGRSR
ncbi:hypothetical protein B0H10DRAFT_2212055 [Mycena sp. CBHHK59/15]|nr:hypothetical protein B0H10DRAFT_2212055 [Mycena sp. CBHHK59/15]